MSKYKQGMNYKNCQSCGREIPVDTEKCPVCGAEQKRIIMYPDSSRTRRLWTIIFPIIIIVIILSIENNTSNITSTTGLNSFATIAAATPSTGSKVENTQDLICKLQSQDSAIRIGAAKALGTLKDQQAIDPLINALQTDDSAFRISVINALAEIGDERAVEPLIAVFQSKNDNTTHHALAIALGIIGGAHATDVLITAFRSGDTNVSEALVLDGEDAVEPLIAILKEQSNAMRLEAVRLLGEIRDGRAVEPLGTALQDEQIQYDAADALGKIGDDRAVALLSACFNSSSNTFLEIVANSLAKIGSTNAENALLEALKDKEAPIYLRQNAALALGKFKDKTAITSLISVMTEYKAIKEPYEFTPTDLQKSIAEALKSIGSEAVEPLLARLSELTANTDKTSIRDYIRDNIIALLGDIGDKRAVEPLLAILSNPDDNCRDEAGLALGKIGDNQALEPLIETLQNALEMIHKYSNSSDDESLRMINYNETVVSQTAEALGALGDDTAIQVLTAASQDKDEIVRINIAAVLSTVNSPLSATCLNDALEQEDLAVVAGAYRYFIKLGKEGSENVLISALKKYGNKGMAEIYFNCGNDVLNKAAKEWANNNGYFIMQNTLGSDSGIAWGSG